jgi:5-methylcytosine-specific restriction endonuclease McrA
MKQELTIDEALRGGHRKLRRKKPALYRRQGGRCGVCGREVAKDELEIHHVVGVSAAPELAFSRKNLLLVCPECHRGLHGE